MCQSRKRPRSARFCRGDKILLYFFAPTAKLPFHVLAERCKRHLPLLAAPAALLLVHGQAKAVLTYNIFESAGAVIVQTSGGLDLTGAPILGFTGSCVAGAIESPLGNICTGPTFSSTAYQISGPNSFNGTVTAYPASNVSGITTVLAGTFSFFAIVPAYTSNTPIVSSAKFNGTTLATLGFTTTGLIGTWTLNGTSETIQLFVGNPPAAAVPGPLPLFGAAAAFGWSRRLRKRTAAPLITPPQA